MAMIYDTSLFNLAMQQNKQAWEGIAEARKSAVQTTYGNLQAKVDKQSAMSDMLGGFAKGFAPVAGNLGKQLGGSFFPGGGGGVQALPWQGGAEAGGWAQTQSGQDVFGASGAPMLPYQSVQSFVGQ